MYSHFKNEYSTVSVHRDEQHGLKYAIIPHLLNICQYALTASASEIEIYDVQSLLDTVFCQSNKSLQKVPMDAKVKCIWF